MHTSRRAAWLLSLLPCALAAGCGKQPPPPESVLPAVVATPVTREIADYEDFTGRTEAVETITVKARVTGYLDEAKFQEGKDVKKGDVLFVVDPRPYALEKERAEANRVQAKAHLDRLNRDFERAKDLLARKGIAQEDYDKIAGDRNEALAALDVALAQLETAELNLEFTTVVAEIDGRISRRLLDPGNLVKADDTALTTIVSMEPMYAYFDVDEATTIRVRRLISAGKIKSSREAPVPVQMGLSDEEGFPHKGLVTFVDNALVPGTGTLEVRGRFPNPTKLLSPGLFVRVRVQVGLPRQALLVPERAVGTDQGQRFLYVLDDKDVVVHRQVEVGAVHDGLIVIEEGLGAGERVVVSNLQRVRPGSKVQPTSAAAATPPPPPPTAGKPIDVVVSKVVKRRVTDYEDFTGRTAASASVDIRARATGYLKTTNFKEGNLVKKGNVLFVIDQRPYLAEVNKAKANLDQAQARVDRLERDFVRAQDLLRRKAMSQEDYDKVAGDRDEAQAAIGVAQALLKIAQLNLEFTTVKAALDGRISRRKIDPNNLVKADETPLTTIVKTDPVYAYFDADERTVLRLRRLLVAGKIKSARDAIVPVAMGLASEEGFPHKGMVTFADNALNPGTGTLLARGTFPNTSPDPNKALFSPGMFARIRVQIGEPHDALLVSERALVMDEGKQYVFVVEKGNVVHRRQIETGPLRDGLRVVEKGLRLGEKVVVSGLQRIRDEAKVNPTDEHMPVAADLSRPALVTNPRGKIQNSK